MVASRKRAQGRTRVVEPSAKQKKFNATVQDIRDRFEARADPSCKLSPKEKFDAAQRDLEKLVDAIGEFLGRKLHFRRILLPEDAEWNESGLKEEFNVIIGHFETDGIGLRGNLRKLRAVVVLGRRVQVWACAGRPEREALGAPELMEDGVD